MRDFMVYEHINGMPSYLDEVHDEATECAMEECRTEKEVERYIEKLNKMHPEDRFGRKRVLYVFWCD